MVGAEGVPVGAAVAAAIYAAEPCSIFGCICGVDEGWSTGTWLIDSTVVYQVSVIHQTALCGHGRVDLRRGQYRVSWLSALGSTSL